MPPRHTYWTIIFGGKATSFRAAARDELLPTFKQIQSKHPDAVMMWFARGRLWHSPEEALEHQRRGGRRAWAPKPPSGERGRDHGERKGPGWRPGGEHKDPRARFKVPRDVKRKRMAAKFGWKKKKDEDT